MWGSWRLVHTCVTTFSTITIVLTKRVRDKKIQIRIKLICSLFENQNPPTNLIVTKDHRIRVSATLVLILKRIIKDWYNNDFVYYVSSFKLTNIIITCIIIGWRVIEQTKIVTGLVTSSNSLQYRVEDKKRLYSLSLPIMIIEIEWIYINLLSGVTTDTLFAWLHWNISCLWR